jgi:hypothetical protein
MIEGSGSIPLTNGSGSRRPKNTWIRIQEDQKHVDPDPGVKKAPHPGSGSATPVYTIVLCCRSAGGGAAGDGQPQQEPRAGEAEGGEPRAKGQG